MDIMQNSSFKLIGRYECNNSIVSKTTVNYNLVKILLEIIDSYYKEKILELMNSHLNKQ
jgi:hypothetical protein